jgi:hypothetical protein
MGWTAGGRRRRESREQLLAPRLHSLWCYCMVCTWNVEMDTNKCVPAKCRYVESAVTVHYLDSIFLPASLCDCNTEMVAMMARERERERERAYLRTSRKV